VGSCDVRLAAPRRVLVINTFGIGDMVMTTPLLHSIRRGWPDAEVTLLVKAFGAERVVSGTSLVDHVIRHEEKDRRSVPSLARLALTLLSLPRFDACIVSTGKNPVLAGAAALAARATWRVGEDIGGRAPFYTHKVTFRPRLHTVLANLRLGVAVGLDDADDTLFFGMSDTEREWASAYLRYHGVSDRDRVVGVQIGCNPTFSQKRWPASHLARLCHLLQERGVGRPLLLGSTAEEGIAREIRAQAGGRLLTAAGHTTLGQAAALLERCDVAVGGDGGLLHVAGALGTPTVAVFGPSDPCRNRPWGGGHKVVSASLPCSPCYPRLRHGCGAVRCMTNVSPQRVCEVVERVLS
jgi:ADP-heptose:LPS heptosyltransferase